MSGIPAHTLSAVPVTRGGAFEKDVMGLYRASFPAVERVPYEALTVGAELGICDNLALVDRGEFVGMAYLIRDEETPCLLYFAVCPEKRGRGYGGSALSLLELMYDGRVFLYVEDPDQDEARRELRLRRLEFYRRNGLNLTGRKISWSGETDYVIVTFRGNVTDDETRDCYLKFENAYAETLGISPRVRERRIRGAAVA